MIQELIDAGLHASGQIDLVDVMARVDFANHSIPTLRQLNHALASVSGGTSFDATSFVLSRVDGDADPVQLDEGQAEAIYRAYLARLKR
jgi:hypothetical protein